MRGVYVALTFFALAAAGLVAWTLLGYRVLLVALGMSDPGIGAAGFALGALWGVFFARLWRMFSEAGQASLDEIAKARGDE
jgi:hypothetical protein